MKIAANAVVYPQQVIDNASICARVRALTPGASADVHTQVERYLEKLGARERRWLAPGEKPIELILRAAAQTWNKCGVEPGSIDNLIYCAVDRALLEPANAALVAHAIGLRHARAFDVVHACQGWFTALEIAGDRADHHGETTLIVTAEFPMSEGGATNPQNFDLSDPMSRRWKFATLVLGEAAAATIVAPGGSPLRSRQRSDNSGYHASYVKLPNAHRFLPASEPAFETAELTFHANSEALVEHGMAIAFDTFESLRAGIDAPIVVVPHTISSRIVAMLLRRYANAFPVVDIFPFAGNVGSVSLPAGLDYLERQPPDGAKRHAVGWMVAAGVTAAAFEFPLA